MAGNRRSALQGVLLRRGEGGFSLIELVLVIAVLGVLAAIAVPVYLGVQNQAKDASVQADLANAEQALTAFGADHDGDLPTSVSRSGVGTYGPASVDLTRYGWTAGAHTTRLSYSRSGPAWCVLGTSSTGAVYAVATRGAVVKSSSCPG